MEKHLELNEKLLNEEITMEEYDEADKLLPSVEELIKAHRKNLNIS